MQEKRMAGDFEIINAVQIGDKEIVLVENPYADKEKYLCSYCESNDFLPLILTLLLAIAMQRRRTNIRT